MKILIAGSGKVGETLVEQLSAEGYDLTVIDSNPETIERMVTGYDVIGLNGNCASMEVLRQAGGEKADLLIAATGSDEINLLCCMSVHALNPKIHTVARIRNPEYTEQAYSMRDVFGLSLAFNPEKQAASEIERILKYPAFLKRDSFAKGRVEIVELKVDKDSKLCGISLSVLNSIVKCKVLVCAVLRDGQAVIPSGNFILQEEDKIFVTAPSYNLTVLLKNLGLMTHKVRKVFLAGGSTICYYLAEALQSYMRVTLIEKDREKSLRLAAQLPDVNVIHGDAGNRLLMESEGLASCDALVTLTGRDEMNMVISMYGNSYGVPKIVTKMDQVDDAKIIDHLPVGSVISPRKLCCGTIVRYVRALQNKNGAARAIHTIADGQAEAMEFVVDEHTLHCGEPLKQIKLKKNVLIACITRAGKIEIPSGDSCFYRGDSVVVVETRDDVLLQFNDIFEE